MPPDAFMFDTSGQLVMQTAIGGTGTLFGPLLGAAVWLFLQDFLQGALDLGAAWKLVLGVVFVLLVCFLRRGHDRRHRRPVCAGDRGEGEGRAEDAIPDAAAEQNAEGQPRTAAAMPARHRELDG